jgi:hypothetical protein
MKKVFFIIILFAGLASAQVSSSSDTTNYVVASDSSTACVTQSDLKEFSNFFLFVFVVSLTAFAFKMGTK